MEYILDYLFSMQKWKDYGRKATTVTLGYFTPFQIFSHPQQLLGCNKYPLIGSCCLSPVRVTNKLAIGSRVCGS
jgi:hypothetical protein